MTSLLAMWGLLPAFGQNFRFIASPFNPPLGQNNGIQGVTGAGPLGFLNTPLNVALGLQANGLKTMNTLDVGVGDFNGDFINDLVALSADNALGIGFPNIVTLTLFLGVGDGTFGIPQVYTLQEATGIPIIFSLPTSLVVADFDLDGISDMAMTARVQLANGVVSSRVLLVYGKDLMNAQPGALVSAINFDANPPGQAGLTGTPVSIAAGRLQSDMTPDIAAALAGTPGGVLEVFHDPTCGCFTGPGVITRVVRTMKSIDDPVVTQVPSPRSIAIARSNLPGSQTLPSDSNLDIFVDGELGTISAPYLAEIRLFNGPFKIGGLAVSKVNSDIAMIAPSGELFVLPAKSPVGAGYLTNAQQVPSNGKCTLTEALDIDKINLQGSSGFVLAGGARGSCVYQNNQGMLQQFRALTDATPSSAVAVRAGPLDVMSSSEAIVAGEIGFRGTGGANVRGWKSTTNTWQPIFAAAILTRTQITGPKQATVGRFVNYDVSVQVGPQGSPLSGVNVALLSNGKVVAIGTTGPQGVYQFPTTFQNSGDTVLTGIAFTLGTNGASNSSLKVTVQPSVTVLPSLTITANPVSTQYGSANPAFTVSYRGFANGDTPADLGGTLTFFTAATAASPVGTYSVTPVGLTSNKYAITYVSGQLTVTPALLTVTANNQTKTYGQTVTFAGTEFTTSGLVNSDSVLGVRLNSAGAVATATVGGSPFSIVPSAAQGTGLANYTITFIPGLFYVSKATPVISLDTPAPIEYATPLNNTQLNATASGPLTCGQGTVTYNPVAGTVLSLGSPPLKYAYYTLTANFAPDPANCNAAVKTVTLTVQDTIAPVTSLSQNPAPNGNGWTNKDTTVGLTAADIVTGTPYFGTGVKNITVTLSGAMNSGATGINGNTATVNVTTSGITTITYSATDNVGNVELPKTSVVKVDKVGPEASSRFNPVTRTVQVYGASSFSGVPATAVAGTCVPINWSHDNNDDNGQDPVLVLDERNGNYADGDKSAAQRCTYTTIDAADNSIVIVADVKADDTANGGPGNNKPEGDDEENHETNFVVVSFRYTVGGVAGPLITPPKNREQFQWSVQKDGTLKDLHQNMVVGTGQDKHQVQADWSAKTNQTLIRDRQTVQKSKGEKDVETQERKITKPGLVLLILTTQKPNKLLIAD